MVRATEWAGALLMETVQLAVRLIVQGTTLCQQRAVTVAVAQVRGLRIVVPIHVETMLV